MPTATKHTLSSSVGGVHAAANTAERLRELEIKLTFLEKHIEEQDRAMLGQYRAHEALSREVQRLSTALKNAQADRQDETRLTENERPPHY
jgi:uncharacterized coiled-coil protein SlyX